MSSAYPPIEVRGPVALALLERRPVVALESTLIAHGLPQPVNLQTALEAEKVVRDSGAVPATIAVLQGIPVIGLTEDEIARLARAPDVAKASTRDLAAAIALNRTAATTVAATMVLAHRAGIRVFATGGIGGVHRPPNSHDVSADLYELAKTPVLVVCAGAKTILDLPRTLETLETLGVPVIGYQSGSFPGFYLRSTGLPIPARADDPRTAARIAECHWRLGGAGLVLAQPLNPSSALAEAELETALVAAEREAVEQGIAGPAVTPFLLKRLAALTGGRTLRANQDLIVANARLAAQVAASLSETSASARPSAAP